MSQNMSKSDSKATAARNKARFLAVFPSIVDELVQSLKVEGMPTEVTEWYKTVSLTFKLPSLARRVRLCLMALIGCW